MRLVVVSTVGEPPRQASQIVRHRRGPAALVPPPFEHPQQLDDCRAGDTQQAGDTSLGAISRGEPFFEPGPAPPPFGDPLRPRIAGRGRCQVRTLDRHIQQCGNAPRLQPLDAGANPAVAALHPVGVLLQVHDGAPFHLEEHGVVRGVLAEECLQVPIELADAGHQRREVVLHLRQQEMYPSRPIVERWTLQEGSEVAKAVADGVEDGRLEPDCTPELAEGVQHPADGGLALAGERPLQVAPLEVFRAGVGRRVILGDLQQAPAGELGEGPLERRLVDRLVPPGCVERRPHLIDVQRWRRDGGVVKCRHQRHVEVAPIGGGEAEQVAIHPPPDPLVLHGRNHRQRV